MHTFTRFAHSRGVESHSVGVIDVPVALKVATAVEDIPLPKRRTMTLPAIRRGSAYQVIGGTCMVPLATL